MEQKLKKDVGRNRLVSVEAEFDFSVQGEPLLEDRPSSLEDSDSLHDKRTAEGSKRPVNQVSEGDKDVQFRSIIDSAIDAIVTIDEQGIIVAADPILEKIFGYRVDELLGRNVSMLVPSPHRERHDQYLARYIATLHDSDDEVLQLEVTGQRKDGSILNLELSISTLMADDRRFFTAILRDISERETVTELLEQYSRELQHSNEELEQYAYVISHDLKEPLRMVTSFTTLLEEELRGSLTEDARKYMMFVIDGAERMRTMIDDLLRYSLVGRGENDMETVDLGEIVSKALHDLSLLIKEADAEIEVDDLPVIQGAPSLLVRLFQNLIGNALKFRGERRPVIHIGAEQDDGSWRLFVRDIGIGIESQHLERIFQVFQRLHPRDVYEGSGIGLAVCRKIVELHGGQLWVESVKDEGSTFWFTFPLDAPQLAETRQKAVLV
jgi:PAS domain S-box-containing protein